MPRRVLLLGLVGAVIGGSVACDFGTSEPFVRRTINYTFEATLAPWEPDGTDLEDPPVDWSIERSDERANQGDWSVRFQLENLNDAGKIWIETPIQHLAPGVTHDVRIAFNFGSSDGEVNAWRIIAGVGTVNPEDTEDLTFQGSTTVAGGEFTWTRKEFAFQVTPSPTGTLWLAVGVWGTSEFPRTYFIDDLDIEIVRGG